MPETKDDYMDALWNDIQKIDTYSGIDVTKNESPEINKMREQLDHVRSALVLIYSRLLALDADKKSGQKLSKEDTPN